MREILLKPELYKFRTFGELGGTFCLGKRDLIFTTEALYEAFVKPYARNVPFLRQDIRDGEPTEDMIEEIFAGLDYDSYDRVIAIGGGTVMDIGKLLCVRRTGTVNELFFKRAELIREKQLIAVPTTCGTGSEVTSTSVAIVKDGHGNTTKLGLLSESLIADTACLIPEFLQTLPDEPFAGSLIDALIHAAEAFLSPGRATMTSDLFARKAIELLLEGLKRNREGSCDLRTDYAEELLTAACYAGIAFLQAGCGTVHGLSYPLSGAYLVRHGEANYAFFEAVLDFYQQKNPQGKIRELQQMIGSVFGCSEEKALRALAEAEHALLPIKQLRQYGVKEADLQLFTQSVFANQKRLVDNSYVPLDEQSVERLYREVY